MQNVQNEILFALTRLFKPTTHAELNITEDDRSAPTRPGAGRKIWAYLIDPKNKRRVFLLLWIFSVMAMLAFTLLALTLSVNVLHSYHSGVLVTVVAWALFFGAFVLFFLPAKLVTTFLGSLAGISVSQIPSGRGLLSKINDFVQSLVSQLLILVGGNDHLDGRFARICIWVFVGIVMVMCLPAFFGTPDTK